MDIIRVEHELKKRLDQPYQWGRKQSNNWDQRTNFIYKTYSYEKLVERCEELTEEERNYAYNRWYNYWSAMAIEHIFASHDKVTPQKNQYDKLIDFSINHIPFDHKTSVYPKTYKQSIDFSLNNKSALIRWLYANQSQQSRKHLKNRLFIILHDSHTFEHWKMKAEIQYIKQRIDNYVAHFTSENLISLTIEEQPILADIIYVLK